ncbi:MAG TPA: hypothetical protein VE971_02645 [Candidatus Eisenbacteria bacterium]|nr:hypothetical protein [Candidatus Eisenbacteria bacterium]
MKFTCYDSRDRKEYINKIKRILKDNGILFLKCFSDKEPMDEGPYKFSQDEIRDLSSIVDSIKETVYVMHSTNKL